MDGAIVKNMNQPKPGTHEGFVSGFTFNVTSKKESEYIELDCQLKDEAFAGQVYRHRLWFTDDTWERSLATLKKAGWDGKDVASLTGLGNKAVDLVLAFDVDEQGVVTNRLRVQFINEIGEVPGFGRLMRPDEVRNFQSRLRGFAARAAQGAPAKAAPEQPTRPLPTTPPDFVSRRPSF